MRSGYGVVTGAIAAAEVDSYTFTLPGGRAIYVASQTEGVFPSLRYRITTPGGRIITGLINDAYLTPRMLQLTEGGTYTLEVLGQNDTQTGDYQLEIQDVADVATAITLDTPFDVEIDPGDVSVFSYEATAFDRQVLRDLNPPSIGVFRVNLDPYGQEQPNLMSSVSGTHYILLKTAYTNDAVDGMLALYSLKSATPLTIDQLVNGTLSPRTAVDFYRFEAEAGDHLYVGDPPDDSTGLARELILPGGLPILVQGVGKATDGILDLPVSGEYVLAVYNVFDSPDEDIPYTLSLTSPPLDNAGTIARTVSCSATSIRPVKRTASKAR